MTVLLRSKFERPYKSTHELYLRGTINVGGKIMKIKGLMPDWCRGTPNSSYPALRSVFGAARMMVGHSIQSGLACSGKNFARGGVSLGERMNASKAQVNKGWGKFPVRTTCFMDICMSRAFHNRDTTETTESYNRGVKPFCPPAVWNEETKTAMPQTGFAVVKMEGGILKRKLVQGAHMSEKHEESKRMHEAKRLQEQAKEAKLANERREEERRFRSNYDYPYPRVAINRQFDQMPVDEVKVIMSHMKRRVRIHDDTGTPRWRNFDNRGITNFYRTNTYVRSNYLFMFDDEMNRMRMKLRGTVNDVHGQVRPRRLTGQDLSILDKAKKYVDDFYDHVNGRGSGPAHMYTDLKAQHNTRTMWQRERDNYDQNF